MSTTFARQRRVVGVVATVVALLAVLTPAPVSAELRSPTTIENWNLYAIEALTNAPTAATPGAGQPPPVGAIHLAMVQGAVYDAVNAIDGTRRPYLAGVSAAPGGSFDAAAATAAHHVLVGMVRPGTTTRVLSQAIRDRLDGLYAATLSGIANGSAKTIGIGAGEDAAAEMLAARASDGRFGSPGFSVGFGVGEWRPEPVPVTTPPTPDNDPNAWVRSVTPFTIQSASQFRSEGPLDIMSDAYTAEFNEVKALGRGTGSTRTPAQTELGLFYTVNPVPVYSKTFRDLAQQRALSAPQEARLFATLTMAGADALISCWDDKEYWSFWRPRSAIRLAASDGNPDTTADESWEPRVFNPPYPDHPSGYNCITGATMHAARDFFGTDKVAFNVTSSGTGATITKPYERFSHVFKDTIEARLYLGIHFRTPNAQGVVMGKKVAHWIDKHFFQPTD